MKYEIYYKGEPTGIYVDEKEYDYNSFCKEFKEVTPSEFAIHIEFKEPVKSE